MIDSDFFCRLTEQDYRAILDFNNLLAKCRRRSDFKELLKDHFLPLLKSYSCVNLFTGPDLSRMRIYDSVNIDRETLSFFPQLFTTDPMDTLLLSCYCPVMVYDVEMNRQELDVTRSRFFLANHQYQSLCHIYIDSVSTTMAALNLPESTIALVFHRLSPEDSACTVQDERLLKLLWPVLAQTFRSILLSEELNRYQSFAGSLTAVAASIALINADWQIVYRNASFDGLFSNQPNGRLPDCLIRILRHEINSYALEKFDAAPVEIPCYRLERRTFRIRLAKIEDNNNEESLWLLRMERIVDAYSKLFRLLQGQGLTVREIEICILLKNGLETRKIAVRLCVSYNTIRNHQQSIFKKTCVTTQVQLIAYLNELQE